MLYAELKYPIYFTLCVGVVSHLLLLICLIKDPLKCFRNSVTYLIMNLALSDFTVCATGLLRMLGVTQSTVIVSVSNTALLASLFSIISIALDRYMLTVHPFKHRVLSTGKRVAIWIVSIWLLCLCPLLKGLIVGPDKVTDSTAYQAIFIIIASLTFFTNLITYFSLKRRAREISQQQSQSRNRVLEEAFLKTIMIVAFAQIATLVPACTDALINGWMVSGSVMVQIIYAMYFLNFAINPFLYIWRVRSYRQTFLLVFCRSCVGTVNI